jgi:SAM-dependent methyltransferase
MKQKNLRTKKGCPMKIQSKHYFFIIFLSVWAYARDVHENAFTYIYDNGVWGGYNQNNQDLGTSGGGSTEKNTREYRKLLELFLKEKEIKTVVDVGCGDWEFSKLIDWNGIEYLGYDVVKSVIEANNAKYATDTLHFVVGNFLTIELPSADLLICKHVLQHISNQDILNFIPQLKKYKYCLITNEVDPKTLSSDNKNIKVGLTRPIDLSKAPFNVSGTKILTYKIDRLGMHQVFLIDNTQD